MIVMTTIETARHHVCFDVHAVRAIVGIPSLNRDGSLQYDHDGDRTTVRWAGSKIFVDGVGALEVDVPPSKVHEAIRSTYAELDAWQTSLMERPS